MTVDIWVGFTVDYLGWNDSRYLGWIYGRLLVGMTVDTWVGMTVDYLGWNDSRLLGLE